MAISKYSEEFKREVVSLYKSGMSKSDIRKKYNISYNTMNHWINNEGHKKTNKNYDKDFINLLMSEYKNGMTVNQISQKYNILSGTIYYWIKKNNISRHRGLQSMCQNESFFDEIDTEMKAYFLGFIVADGNVSNYNQQYSLKISLQHVDRYIIERLLIELDCTNNIRDFVQKSPESDRYYKYSYVSITNKHLVKSLFSLGVIPNKTFHEILPKDKIPNNLIHHFIRGFFDGDGIVGYTNKTSGFGFIGNKEILTSIQKEIGWEDIKLREHHTTKNIFTFMSSNKKKVNNLFHYMYDDATFYLCRKHDKMLAMINGAALGIDYKNPKVTKTELSGDREESEPKTM